MAALQEDKKLYLQEDIENFTFGGWECTLWTRVFLRVDLCEVLLTQPEPCQIMAGARNVLGHHQQLLGLDSFSS